MKVLLTATVEDDGGLRTETSEVIRDEGDPPRSMALTVMAAVLLHSARAMVEDTDRGRIRAVVLKRLTNALNEIHELPGFGGPEMIEATEPVEKRAH